MKIALGSKVRDIVSGFEGIVTGKADYLTGCIQCLVSHDKLDKDGKMLDGVWLDESRLTVLAEPSEAIVSVRGAMAANPGGPQREAPARR